MAYILCPFVERLSLSPTAYSQIVAQQKSMPKSTIIVSQVVAFYIQCFSVFFQWMRPPNVEVLLAVIRSRFGHRPRCTLMSRNTSKAVCLVNTAKRLTGLLRCPQGTGLSLNHSKSLRLILSSTNPSRKVTDLSCLSSITSHASSF